MTTLVASLNGHPFSGDRSLSGIDQAASVRGVYSRRPGTGRGRGKSRRGLTREVSPPHFFRSLPSASVSQIFSRFPNLRTSAARSGFHLPTGE